MIHIILGIILILAALLIGVLLFFMSNSERVAGVSAHGIPTGLLFFVASIVFSVMLMCGKGGIYGWGALVSTIFMCFGIVSYSYRGYERRHSAAESQDESQDA